MLAEGLSQQAIREQLRKEYGVEVKKEVLGYAIKQKFGGAGPIYQAAMARENAEMHQRALERYEHFMAKYEDAVEGGDFQEAKFYAREAGRWWNRIYKAFHKGADRVEVQMQDGSKETEWLNIVLDEIADADPEAVERILHRLGEDQGAVGL